MPTPSETVAAVAYPSLLENRSKQVGRAYIMILAAKHMIGEDSDYLFSEAMLWVSARTGLGYHEAQCIYINACTMLGWDGKPGSMVGVKRKD